VADILACKKLHHRYVQGLKSPLAAAPSLLCDSLTAKQFLGWCVPAQVTNMIRSSLKPKPARSYDVIALLA
jgi:hypothetical protein